MRKILIVTADRSAMSRFLNLSTGDDTVLHLDEGMEIPKPGGDAPAPVWVAIFPIGVTRFRPDFPGGRIEFSDAFCRRMIENWTAAGKPRKPINYFHRGQTLEGDTTPIEQKLAAGWMSDFKIAPDADGKPFMWALTSWTEKARGHILADELCRISPEFNVDGLNKVTGKRQGPTLHGAALLNDPYLEELPRVAAANNPNAANAAETTMDRNKLIAALVLAATATDEDILKALNDQKVKLGELEQEKKNLQMQLADATAKAEKVNLAESASTKLAGDLAAATARITTLSNEIAAMKAKETEGAIDAYIKERQQKGIILPPQVDGVKALALSVGLDKVKAIYDSAQPQIALGERGVTGPAQSADANKAHTEYVQLMDKYEKEGLNPMQADRRIRTERPELVKPMPLSPAPSAAPRE